MRLAWIRHVPFEGLGAIGEWAEARGLEVTEIRAYEEEFPHPDEFDFLVVMGGAMNVYQEREFPWLAPEKAFIRSAIESGKLVLGVCLGAQLLADVLGGRVSRNAYREIGWFDVELTEDGERSAVFGVLPSRFRALHWHGDTFEIPPGAEHTARSEACANQGFSYDGGRVVGAQFHLEVTQEGLGKLVAACADELEPGPWVSDPAELLGTAAEFDASHVLAFGMLDAMIAAKVDREGRDG